MNEILLCHRCGQTLTPGAGNLWVVRIEAMADPWPAPITEDDLKRDTHAEWRRLVEQMKACDTKELTDQIYRRLVIHLCDKCYAHWIESPAG